MKKQPSDNKNYLSTHEVANLLNMSQETIRDLCRSGVLKGAYKITNNGPWYIPQNAIRKIKKSDNNTPPKLWLRYRNNPWIFYPATIISAIVSIISLLTIISVITDFGPAKRQLEEWGVIHLFDGEQSGETLIIISYFYYPNGVMNTEAHKEIYNDLQNTIIANNIPNIRIEYEPTRIEVDNLDLAQKIAERYKASMIIWGEDTGIRFSVSILSYMDLDTFDFFKYSDTGLGQIVKPDEYSTFITAKLGQITTFSSLYCIASLYEENGQYSSAIDLLIKLITSIESAFPENRASIAELYAEIGFNYILLGDYDAAFSNYQNAINNNDKNPSLYLMRGLLQDSQGNYENAYADYMKAINIDPEFSEAYVNLSTTQYHLNDIPGALKSVNLAIQLNSENELAYMNRGNLNVVLGDLSGARSDYYRAVDINPSNPETFYNRGVFLAMIGDLDGAISDFNKVILISPDHIDVYFAQGLAYYQLKKYQEAMSDFNQYLSLTENNDNAIQVIKYMSEIENLSP